MATSGTMKAVIAVIIVVGAIWYLSGNTDMLNVGSQKTSATAPVFETKDTAVGTATYSGDMTMKVLLSDTIDSTQYTDSTQADINYYKQNADGTYTFLTTSSGGSVTLPVANGQKYVFAEVENPSGQAFYTDASSTASASDRVSTFAYDDWDKDNIKSYIFRIDISDIQANADPSITPSRTWFVKLIQDGTISLTTNAVTSEGSVGQGQVESTLEFEPTFSARSTGVALTEIKLTTNSTDTTQWYEDQSWIDIPTSSGTQRIKLSEMDRSDMSSTTVYKYKYATGVDGSNFVSIGNTGSLKTQAPLTVTTNFDASNEALCWELQLTDVTARGVYATTSDDGEIAEGSVSDECTIS